MKEPPYPPAFGGKKALFMSAILSFETVLEITQLDSIL